MRKVPSDADFFWTRKRLGPGGALGTVPFSVDSSSAAVVHVHRGVPKILIITVLLFLK